MNDLVARIEALKAIPLAESNNELAQAEAHMAWAKKRANAREALAVLVERIMVLLAEAEEHESILLATDVEWSAIKPNIPGREEAVKAWEDLTGESIPKVDDDNDATRVAKMPAKAPSGPRKPPKRELPPPPKSHVMASLSARQAHCFVSLTGELQVLEPSAVKGVTPTIVDQGCYPEDAYEYALELAQAANGELEGTITAWHMTALGEHFVFWEFNGNA